MLDEVDHISPVTTLVQTDMVIYYSKTGGAATLLQNSEYTWSEIDATNMPGLYYYTVTETDISDTLGELTLMLKGTLASPPTQTDKMIETMFVVPVTADTALGLGIRKVTITSTGINSVDVSIMDNTDTELQVKGNTGTGQSIDFYLNDGNYKIRSAKPGYTFTLDSLTVVQDMNQNVVGTPIDNIDPAAPQNVAVPASEIPEQPVVHP